MKGLISVTVTAVIFIYLALSMDALGEEPNSIVERLQGQWKQTIDGKWIDRYSGKKVKIWKEEKEFRRESVDGQEVTISRCTFWDLFCEEKTEKWALESDRSLKLLDGADHQLAKGRYYPKWNWAFLRVGEGPGAATIDIRFVSHNEIVIYEKENFINDNGRKILSIVRHELTRIN